ncbi:hypothetical protein AB0J82_28360 [Asanoa sp. NPDC049518]|uniref:hypothetical protein n=1 Tax=unclassified Asanoa TaxID=2685164 RepID=UPI00341D35F6
MNVRDMLLDAVPPLPSPPDRIAAVGRRYRRRRRRAAVAGTLALAILAGVAAGLPQLTRRESLEPVRPVGPATCPQTTGDRAGRDWVSAGDGRVLPGNPVEVVACDLDVDVRSPAADPLYPPASPPRALSGGADVVAALNRVSPVIACYDIYGLRQPVFLLRYADRPPVFVNLNPDCRRDASWDEPLRVFLTDFREQRLRTTTAADVPTPTCDPTVDVPSLWLDRTPPWAGPLTLGVLAGEPPLPFEPAAATFCRYAFERPLASLRTAEHATDAGQRFRTAVNEAPSNGAGCPKRTDHLVLDVVKVADLAGVAPAEFRYLRTRSCVDGVQASPAVLAAVDEVLGPIS